MPRFQPFHRACSAAGFGCTHAASSITPRGLTPHPEPLRSSGRRGSCSKSCTKDGERGCPRCPEHRNHQVSTGLHYNLAYLFARERELSPSTAVCKGSGAAAGFSLFILARCAAAAATWTTHTKQCPTNAKLSYHAKQLLLLKFLQNQNQNPAARGTCCKQK